MRKEQIKYFLNNLNGRWFRGAIFCVLLCIGAFVLFGHYRLSRPGGSAQNSESLEALIRRLNQLLVELELKKTGTTEYSEVLSDLSLVGIIWTSQQPLAVINNLIVGEGDHIRNFSVEKINADSVELRDETRKTLLLYLSAHK